MWRALTCINLLIEKKPKDRKQKRNWTYLQGHMNNLVDKAITKEIARYALDVEA